jgi:hypothetical protein
VIELPGVRGGSMCKVALYQVVVVQKSGTAVEVGVRLDHGPNGQQYTTHSTPIAQVAVTAAAPTLLSGQADATMVIGEWMRPMLLVGSTGSTAEWAMVEVYELRKPF